MAESKSSNPLAVEQAAVSFGTIAELAHTVSRMCGDVILRMSDPEEHAEDFAVAARDLASQIGLLADIGAKSLGGVPFTGTDPADWLQPPVYPRLKESGRA